MANPKPDHSQIAPGMTVETTGGDLGEADFTKPVVTEVVADEAGNVHRLRLKKGVLFTKEIEVPAARVRAVDTGGDNAGKVTIAATAEETEALAPVGLEALEGCGDPEPEQTDGAIEQLENAMPTDVGMRRREREEEVAPQDPLAKETDLRKVGLFKMLGPGFLSGMASNDSSAVTAYAADGAAIGFGHLWLLLLATPLLQAVQFACAKIGRVKQEGLADILREHYGRRVAVPAAGVLIFANIALIAADLVAVSSGLELITGWRWIFFLLPVGVALWYVTVYQNFDAIKKIFLIMSLVFVSYLVTGILAKPDWGQVLAGTFIPHLDFSLAGVSAAVALLGATISPFSMFWQVQGEKEESRPGTRRLQLRIAAIDIASGVLSGNVVAYFIIVSTAATLFAHHQPMHTALDAARALEPLLGPAGKYLFALGLVGAGLVAIPVLLASTSYAVAGSAGWPASLSKKPWQNEGFYIILTAALVAGLAVAALGIDPIQLLFWANVLQGVLAPILIVLLLLVGNNRAIMKDERLGWITNTGLVIAALVMAGATVLLAFGLLSGQGGS